MSKISGSHSKPVGQTPEPAGADSVQPDQGQKPAGGSKGIAHNTQDKFEVIKPSNLDLMTRKTGHLTLPDQTNLHQPGPGVQPNVDPSDLPKELLNLGSGLFGSGAAAGSGPEIHEPRTPPDPSPDGPEAKPRGGLDDVRGTGLGMSHEPIHRELPTRPSSHKGPGPRTPTLETPIKPRPGDTAASPTPDGGPGPTDPRFQRPMPVPAPDPPDPPDPDPDNVSVNLNQLQNFASFPTPDGPAPPDPRFSGPNIPDPGPVPSEPPPKPKDLK